MEQVTYSFHLKLSKNYNSGGVDISYTADVKEGETPEEAYKRAEDFVENKVAVKMKELDGLLKEL
jgi:hypothetical protein